MVNHLKAYRKSCRLTLEQVAHMAGTSKSYVWDLENGRCEPSLRIAYAVSSAVGQEIQTVFPDPHDYNVHNLGFVKSVVRYAV